MKNNKLVSMLLCAIIISSSTIFSRYKSAPLQHIQNRNMSIHQQNSSSLFFNYKVLDAYDCKKFFNSKKILKKGYQPVQIKFTNKSASSVIVSPYNFSFRCADALDVANSLHRDGMMRGIGFAVGSLWFTPLIFPALVQGCGAQRYNQDMDLDFEKKAFKTQTVSPYTTVEGVIFVSRDEFSRHFSLTVESVDEKNSYTLYSI